ncbi:MAG: acyl carrier protein [Planctomycetaceae bacterium]|jgi:acyl carrier protein|nr:acyl carrier protein [Planctomycetaceae bacterium]
MSSKKEEIFQGVKEALVVALAVDDDAVTPDATLMGDLGAESIDILDIIYRMEKTFGIKIDQAEFIPSDLLNSPEFKQGDKLTDAGIGELRKRLPYANLDTFVKNPVVSNIITVLTVNDLCYLIETKIAS